jgi:hypothetical protein
MTDDNPIDSSLIKKFQKMIIADSENYFEGIFEST